MVQPTLRKCPVFAGWIGPNDSDHVTASEDHGIMHVRLSRIASGIRSNRMGEGQNACAYKSVANTNSPIRSINKSLPDQTDPVYAKQKQNMATAGCSNRSGRCERQSTPPERISGGRLFHQGTRMFDTRPLLPVQGLTMPDPSIMTARMQNPAGESQP